MLLYACQPGLLDAARFRSTVSFRTTVSQLACRMHESRGETGEYLRAAAQHAPTTSTLQTMFITLIVVESTSDVTMTGRSCE